MDEKEQRHILFNYFLYIFAFIVLCFVGISSIFADTETNIGYLSDKSDVYVAVTYDTPSNAPLPVNQNQSYYIPGIWSLNISVANYSFSANVIYELEINLPQTTFNNNVNSVTVIGGNNSGCSYISHRRFDGHYPRVRFSCTNASNGVSIDISNSNHNNIISGDNFRWNYTYLVLINVSQDTTIIEQNNQIINQNNQIIQGQQDIINNQNQNTQEMIDSQKVCNSISVEMSPSTANNFSTTGYLNGSGSVVDYSTARISNYINVSANSTYHITRSLGQGNGMGYCLYNDSKTIISCATYGSNLDVSITPTSDGYIRFSGYVGTTGATTTTLTGKTCLNGNQALDNTLNDSDIDDATSEASDFFSDFTTNTFGLTSIITAPLNLIQSISSSTCTTLNLPLPYLSNKYLQLPCMSVIYSTYFGTFFTLYQTITYGIIAYWVCVRIFNLVKDFKNPEHDEIEVVDL